MGKTFKDSGNKRSLRGRRGERNTNVALISYGSYGMNYVPPAINHDNRSNMHRKNTNSEYSVDYDDGDSED